jgi:hypothetical protein
LQKCARGKPDRGFKRFKKTKNNRKEFAKCGSKNHDAHDERSVKYDVRSAGFLQHSQR